MFYLFNNEGMNNIYGIIVIYNNGLNVYIIIFIEEFKIYIKNVEKFV